MCLHVCAHTCSTGGGQKKALDSPRTGDMVGCAQPDERKCQDPNLGSLGEAPSSFSKQKTLHHPVWFFVLFLF